MLEERKYTGGGGGGGDYLNLFNVILTNPPDFSGLSRFFASNPILALKTQRNAHLEF